MDDDALDGTAALYGEDAIDDGTINYGPLVLTVAPKVRAESSWGRNALTEPRGR